MALKYNGNGFIPGIPARDLTGAEAEQFGEELRSTLDKEDPRQEMSNVELLINTGLYTVGPYGIDVDEESDQ